MVFLVCEGRAGLAAQCSDLSPTDHATNPSPFFHRFLAGASPAAMDDTGVRGGKKALPSSSSREACF